ncbi:hypothetical protein ABEG17_06505 [Pedococcus sp. KACC 23699]|uniref:Tellurium resistance protein n=1 Tax=Pedococcus sp. KACC 23699 TaxID=3149228 RepID=A0AAU7JXD7_9MICO
MSSPFDKFTKPEVPAAPPLMAPAAVGPPKINFDRQPAAPNLDQASTAVQPTPTQHTSGTINLSKGKSINLSKGSGLMTATCSWPPATDYDVYALVLFTDGRIETVSTFGIKGREQDYRASTVDGSVRHLGDVRRSNATTASETVEIRLTPDVVAVLPVVYSAQSNGTGSFRRYQVSMSIDNGAGATVVIDASNASDNDRIYSCVPGIIINAAHGVKIEAREEYSRPDSENRPVLNRDLSIAMDAGPLNAYK